MSIGTPGNGRRCESCCEVVDGKKRLYTLRNERHFVVCVCAACKTSIKRHIKQRDQRMRRPTTTRHRAR